MHAAVSPAPTLADLDDATLEASCVLRLLPAARPGQRRQTRGRLTAVPGLWPNAIPSLPCPLLALQEPLLLMLALLLPLLLHLLRVPPLRNVLARLVV